MNVGDRFGTLEVVKIVRGKRRDGTEGAPVLVTVRCTKCDDGVERTVLPATLTRTKHPLRSCGRKGCRTRRPSSVKREPEIWYCKQRGTADGLTTQ